MEMVTIGNLADKSVYKRSCGSLFLKLNERFHVKTKRSEDEKSWLGDGCAEELSPKEEVQVVQAA